MPETKDVTVKELQEAVVALRDEVKKGNPDQEVLEKINKTLDAQETQNQKLLGELKTSEQKAEEQKERIDALEVELARGVKGNKADYRTTEEYKALESFCKHGENIEQKALLRTDVDVQGGYLVTTEMDNVITRNIVEIDQMRAVSRVRTIAAKTLVMASRTKGLTAEYEGEAEEGTEDAETYGSDSVMTYRQTVTIPITQDMLMDSAFNMESEIMADASEAFAVGEGNGFVVGTGFKQPEGFTTNATIQAAASTSLVSGVVNATDMILLTGELKTGYNPVYAMNRKTLAQMRALRTDAITAADGAGLFLWQPGMDGNVANTINGFPYIILPSMTDVAANSFSVAFGDFRRGYVIIDRTGVSVIRDNVTQKKKAIVEFTVHRWNTGQVTVAEAIKLLKTKA